MTSSELENKNTVSGSLGRGTSWTCFLVVCYEEQGRGLKGSCLMVCGGWGRGGEGRAVTSKWQDGKDDAQYQEGGPPIPIY